jgi:anti-sigma-K factor RskA
MAAVTTAAAAVSVVGWSLAGRSAQPASPVAVHFRGTNQASDATGILTYDPRTRQSVIVVEGLPAPPRAPAPISETDSYELWLIRADNSMVAAAYLTRTPDGHTWTAALSGDLSHYDALEATIEPPGGSRTPTGPEVIHTTLPRATS